MRDQAFCSLLKRDVTSNIKAKGNPLVSVLVCNVLLIAFLEEENWPESFVKVCRFVSNPKTAKTLMTLARYKSGQ